MADLLSSLNPDQCAAVTQVDGPVLVLAGAGSGKTRVIVHRIAYLIEALGVRPWSVLAVTFTNKAAGEMRERLAQLLGPGARDVWMSTFHSFGASLLRREADKLGLTRSFTIYDDDDQISLAKRILKESNREADQSAARDLLSAVDRLKNGMGEEPDQSTSDAMRRYQAALKAANAVDFGDLLALPVELFRNHPDVLEHYRRRFSHVLVDEFQDTNAVQYQLLRLLCPPPKSNLCVVGDDDQSIYRWRGAEVGNILGFENDYPGAGVVRLTQNYRSDGNILAAAAAVITKNPHRHEKTLWTQREAGQPIEVLYAQDERDEGDRITRALRDLHAEGIPYGEMAIFFRVNAQSRVLEEALRVSRIPYVIVRGRSFYERAEIKDAVSYLRLSVNPRSDVDLLRVLNSPPRGIGDTTVDRLTRHASERGLAVYDALAGPELDAIDGLNAGARSRLLSFRALLGELSDVARSGSAAETAQAALQKSGMLGRLADQSQKLQNSPQQREEAEDRHGNLMEFVGAAREADERFAVVTSDTAAREAGAGSPLLSFLEQVSLLGDADGETSSERVSVMTLHAAKGLEFDGVIIAGMEESVFPNNRALHFRAAPEEMHEERRLAYVGITRARKRLFLSAARARALFGELKFNAPSRFLMDIPEELLRRSGMPPSRAPQATEGYSIDRSYDQTSYPSAPTYSRAGYVRRPVSRPGRSVEAWNASRKVATTVIRVESVDWPTGLAVVHPSFGLGKVVAADGNGPDAKLTVRFGAAGEKRIVARFIKRVE